MCCAKSFVVLLSFLLFSGAVSNSDVFSKTADSFNKFAFEFSEVAFKNNEGNTVCSPFSTAMVLLMVTYGSKGATLHQLISVLHLDSYKSQLSGKNIRNIINSLEGLTEVKYRLANKIYVSDALPLNPRYKFALKSAFNFEIESVNFSDSAKVAKNVNDWCAAKTENKIKNIVNPDALDINTKMMLINSVYFNGEWEKSFETVDSQYFYPEGEEKYNVPMMYKEEMMKYGDLDDYSGYFIGLSYKSINESDATTLYIIVPKPNKKLSDIDLKKITLEKLSSPESVKIHLTIPKFKLESSLDLKKPLNELGLTNLFNYDADLREIVNDSDFYVNSVHQKSFLDVNEKGAEAASVTEFDAVDRSSFDDDEIELYFNVDRPFYVVIANKHLVTFVARVNRP